VQTREEFLESLASVTQRQLRERYTAQLERTGGLERRSLDQGLKHTGRYQRSARGVLARRELDRGGDVEWQVADALAEGQQGIDPCRTTPRRYRTVIPLTSAQPGSP
jgi:hypothetical protein